MHGGDEVLTACFSHVIAAHNAMLANLLVRIALLSGLDTSCAPHGANHSL